MIMAEMDKNNLKISVIMPVYNVEKYLPQCLDSIVLQTYKNLEIICINDGSTDGSAAILEDYAKRDKRIQIITQKNQGLSTARNTGYDVATGDYVYFIDSDDYAALGLFEKFVSVVQKEDCIIDIFMFNGLFYYEYVTPYDYTIGKTGSIQDWGDFSKSHYKDWRQHKNPLDLDMAMWTKIYRKAFLDEHQIRSADGRVFQDKLFNAEAYLAAENLYLVEDYMYIYRKQGSSILHTLNKNVFDCYAIADGLERVYKKYNDFERAKYQFFEHLVRQMFHHVHTVPHDLENKFWDEGRTRLQKIYPLLENVENNAPKGYPIYADIMNLSAAEFREKYKGARWI